MRPAVLHVVDSFNQGGTERQAVQLTRLLVESGRYQIHLACLNPQGPLRAEVDRLGLGEIAAYPLTSFHNLNAAVQLRQLARQLRRLGVAVVHTHDFYTNVFGMAAAALARVPVRIASRRETEGLRTPAQRWLERRSYGLAHAVIANAEAVRTQLSRERVSTEKIVTVYNGLDFDGLMPTPGLSRMQTLAHLGLGNVGNQRVVTIVANFRHTVKDQATFLRAACHVRERIPDVVFVLAGEGPLINSVKALASQLGLAQAVYFIGHCQRVADLLAVSDVCALSSRGEGLSNAILEYMALGRPVVATDVGGTREAVVHGTTGFVVAPGDPLSMAERISELVSDPARARAMGECGRRWAERHFSCSAQLRATEELYDQLLHDPQVRPRSQSPVPAASCESPRQSLSRGSLPL